MILVDDVHIRVKAGNGGNGGTAKKSIFGTRKMVADGGNGGKGGDIYFLGDHNISDLSEFQYKKEIKGKNGVNGLNKDLDGANADDIFVKVPFGTTITDEESKESFEILNTTPFLVAYGGRGGMGNHDYNPSIKDFFAREKDGQMGEERKLHLILNMIADIGIVGFPNAGKSSLLKALTQATPRIGNYQFTTLSPNLGVLEMSSNNDIKENRLILADIPGLIEGASEGKGLGVKFLKHIKKTKALLHCIDSSSDDILLTYRKVQNEFESFDPLLLEKEEIILLTKIDLIDRQLLEQQKEKLKILKKVVLPVSIYDDKSLTELRELIFKKLK